MEIVLPWPQGLSPNRARRTTMAARTGHEADDRKRAAECVPAGAYMFPDGDIPVEYVFHPPYRHKWDAGNCHFAVKALQDGVADALGVDDSRFWPVTLRCGEAVAGGRVVMRVGNDDGIRS